MLSQLAASPGEGGGKGVRRMEDPKKPREIEGSAVRAEPQEMKSG